MDAHHAGPAKENKPNLLPFAEQLHGRGVALRVLTFGGGAGDASTPMARDLGMSRATLYRRIRELPQATTI